MGNQPMRLLDLFCGAGGAAMGYHRAGFDEIVGVDIKRQDNYPFTAIRANAIDVLDVLTQKRPLRDSGYRLHDFDAIHASPPCQGYSSHVTSASSEWVPTLGKDEPKLIAETRALLEATGLPYVMENVMGARRDLAGSLLLCGTMFGLPIRRHRIFESSHLIWSPVHECRPAAKEYAAERGWEYRDMSVTGKGRRTGTADRWREIIGIDWPTTQHELAEAIPPAYTEYIGRQLLEAKCPSQK